MKSNGRLQYRPPYVTSESDENNFPNGITKTVTRTLPNNDRTSTIYYLIKLDGNENLEVMVGKFVDNLNKYCDAAGLNGPECFTQTIELLEGKARTYYKNLLNDPNGAYVLPHNINRNVAQHQRSFRDLWTKLFDETWLGNACLEQIRGWSLSKYKSDANQSLCDLWVTQEGRKDDLREFCTDRMHYNGNPIDEPEKIAHLKSKVPENMWKNANKIRELDNLNTAMEICETLDREYEPEFDKSMKDKKTKNDKGNGKRKPEDSSNDDQSHKKHRNGDRNGDRNGNRNGRRNNRYGRRNDQNNHRRPQHNASKDKPRNGNSTVVLENGWTGKWMNCPVNPESEKFDWTRAKKYQFDEGGKDTWYLDSLSRKLEGVDPSGRSQTTKRHSLIRRTFHTLLRRTPIIMECRRRRAMFRPSIKVSPITTRVRSIRLHRATVRRRRHRTRRTLRHPLEAHQPDTSETPSQTAPLCLLRVIMMEYRMLSILRKQMKKHGSISRKPTPQR